MKRVGLCRSIVGNRTERIEGNFSVRFVAATLDYFDRSVKKRTDALGLSDRVFLTGGQNCPRWTSPNAIHDRQLSQRFTLRSDDRRIGLTLPQCRSRGTRHNERGDRVSKLEHYL